MKRLAPLARLASVPDKEPGDQQPTYWGDQHRKFSHGSSLLRTRRATKCRIAEAKTQRVLVAARNQDGPDVP